MTFYQWLKLQGKRDDPVGDFARDAMNDSDRPKRRATLEQWRQHLFDMYACDGAMEALERAWKEYCQAIAHFSATSVPL